jgi:osmotically-inducible protein OsmY
VEQVRAAVTPAGADSSAVQTVQVTAAGGVVTLKGNVKTEEEKTRMETAAKAVPGVTKVENQIEVKAE